MKFIFFILLLVCQLGYSQGFIVNGFVKDATTGEPLLAALVTLCDNVYVTDIEGRFTFEVDEKKCALQVQYLGYELFNELINIPIEEEDDFIVFLNRSDNILNQAVITASKFQQRQSESTVSLEVLKPEIFSLMNASSTDQVLDMIPGVDVLDGQANIRGGSGYAYGVGSRVQLVIDGMPALQFDGGVSQWNDIAQENIEQVEVLKGAASVLYGSSALNGVIQFTTANPGKEPKTKAGVSYRHFYAPEDSRRQWWDQSPYETNAYFSHLRKIGILDLTAGGFFNVLRSYNQDTYENRGRLFSKLRLRLTPKRKIGLNIDVNLADNSSFFYWGNALRKSYQPGDNTVTTSEVFRFKVDPYFTQFDSRGDKHDIKGRIYGAHNINNNNQAVVSYFEYLNYSYTRNVNNGAGTIIAGFEGLANQTSAQLYGNNNYFGYNGALFVQYNQKVWGKLNILVGGRFEGNVLQNESFEYTVAAQTYFIDNQVEIESKPVFRTGLNYNPLPGMYLRASAGQGYRFPTIAEKFTFTNAGGLTVVPNPELQSETGISTELGLRQEMKWKGLSGYIDLAGFYSQYNNMMEFTLSDQVFAGFQARNIGDTEIPGFEGSTGVQFKWEDLKIGGLFAYTYINPKYRNFSEEIRNSATSDENILKYRYRHSLKSNVNIEFAGLRIYFYQRYNSHMESIDNNFEQFISGIRDFRRNFATGFNTYGMQISYQFPYIKATMGVDNITNELYTERPALLEAPKSISFRLEFDI